MENEMRLADTLRIDLSAAPIHKLAFKHRDYGGHEDHLDN
jgi:hypothetical protein